MTNERPAAGPNWLGPVRMSSSRTRHWLGPVRLEGAPLGAGPKRPEEQKRLEQDAGKRAG